MKSQVDFSGFALSYKAWAYWQSIRSAQQMGILLGSEDKTTFGVMPSLLAPSVGATGPPSLTPSLRPFSRRSMLAAPAYRLLLPPPLTPFSVSLPPLSYASSPSLPPLCPSCRLRPPYSSTSRGYCYLQPYGGGRFVASFR